MTSRANYDGLTRLRAAGTWSPQPSTFPIVLDKEIRGGLRYCSGSDGDTLTNIPGSMLQEGMLVYLENTTGTFTGGNYYQYLLQDGESRNTDTGAMPNANANWTRFNAGGAGGAVDAQGVADVEALNNLADELDADNDGDLVQLLDSTDFNDTAETDPNVTGIPDPIPFTPGADIAVILRWSQEGTTGGIWQYQRFVRNNPDAAYVLEAGDTMTGSLTMGAGNDIVFTGTNNATPAVNRTITVSVPEGSADFDNNYEIVLPAGEPTDANRTLRVSNTATDGAITSPYTLEWDAGGAAAIDGNRVLGNNTADSAVPTAVQVATDMIANDAVTYGKIQNVATANRLLGSTAADGAVSEVQVGLNMINAADGAANRVLAINADNNGLAWAEVGGGFASGTRMLFNQTAAPTGWTKQTATDLNNVGLRLVTGTVTPGGNNPFTTTFGTSKNTGLTTLSEAQLGAHRHLLITNGPGSGPNGSVRGWAGLSPGRYGPMYTSPSNAGTGEANQHQHTMDNFDLKYVDVIIAQAD